MNITWKRYRKKKIMIGTGILQAQRDRKRGGEISQYIYLETQYKVAVVLFKDEPIRYVKMMDT